MAAGTLRESRNKRTAEQVRKTCILRIWKKHENCIYIKGRAGPQPPQHRVGDPATKTGRHHRTVGFRKVDPPSTPSSPKGSDAMSRPLGLCPAVPRQDQQARCRHHRGNCAGHRHRTEGQHRNPCSTVGTTTEIYDYLKPLRPHRAHTFRPSRAKKSAASTDDVAEYPLLEHRGQRIVIGSPAGARRRAGDHRKADAAALGGFHASLHRR